MVRRGEAVAMSTLPIFDYGAPAEGPGAGDAGAPGQPAAVPEVAVPTDLAAFAREAAIVPPEGADDLVSRAQWQWAIGESEAARGAKGASSAGDGGATSPGTTKKRPTPRSRASPPVPGKTVPKTSERDKIALPSTKNASTGNAQTEGRRAAETAIARVEVEQAREKLAVVERLLEEKPVACADGEYAKDGNTKNDADALGALRRLVAPLTGEEFMRACEERRLAGKCGWPLCGKTWEGEGGRDGDGVRRRVTTPDGSAGSVRGGRGTYRIDAVRRKVYLRGDLAMFCGDAHREEAEAIGVSLAISLEAKSEASEKAEKEKEPASSRGTVVEPNGSFPGSFAKNNDARDAKAKAMGDANVHVKASVLEKRPPAVVERRAPDAPPRSPASLPPGLLGGEREKNKTAAAAAVEGYVPRQNKNRSKTRSASKRRTDERRAEEAPVRTEPEAPPSLSRSADASEREPVVSRRALASPLGARALDAHLERNGVGFPDDVKPDAPSEPSDAGPGATFFFDVFAEGLEKAERGANMMGTFSEGQLSRVLPEAALEELGLELGDELGDGDEKKAREKGENGGDAANDAAVAAAMAAATRAADAAADAAGGDDARRVAAAEEALVKAREALKTTLTSRVGAGEEPRDGRDGDDEDDGSNADSDSDDSDALVAAGGAAAVSEFGATWMMLDGWVTRATFAYVSADDVDAESESERRDISKRPSDGGASDGENEPKKSALPPRLGYAKQMSDAAASELRRALPSVRAALGIRASALQLERSLGELLRTFFFDAAIPGLRPERWALLVAAMLERGVAARAAAAARKRSAANAKEKNASGTKHDAAVVPPIVEDVAAARRDGGPLWALVAAAGATKEEYGAYGDLIAGECAKSW